VRRAGASARKSTGITVFTGMVVGRFAAKRRAAAAAAE
jgi:hypothetical protein